MNGNSADSSEQAVERREGGGPHQHRVGDDQHLARRIIPGMVTAQQPVVEQEQPGHNFPGGATDRLATFTYQEVRLQAA